MSADGAFRVWRADEVDWRFGTCEAPGCFARPEVLADFDVDRQEGVPLCCTDADILLERELALIAYRGAASLLPDPWELARRPRPPWTPRRPEVEGRTPEKWLAEEGWFGEAARRRVADDPDWDFPEEWGP